MNKYIIKAVENKYGFNPQSACIEDLKKVEEIIASDVTGISNSVEWDFSAFPNLRKIDCSFNGIEKLNVSHNPLLEEIRWEGVRGELQTIDFSKNTKLKKIRGGQDGMVELDLSANIELEEIEMCLNRYMRWINLDNCTNLRRIDLKGIIMPFVDLTHCNKLEYVNIHYLNLYARRLNEFGPGYPRPIIFVRPNFNEAIIPQNTRSQKYFAYYLVNTDFGSEEEKVLLALKAEKQRILNIFADRYGECVAEEHYRILSMLENCHHADCQHSNPSNNSNCQHSNPSNNSNDLPF